MPSLSGLHPPESRQKNALLQTATNIEHTCFQTLVALSTHMFFSSRNGDGVERVKHTLHSLHLSARVGDVFHGSLWTRKPKPQSRPSAHFSVSPWRKYRYRQ